MRAERRVGRAGRGGWRCVGSAVAGTAKAVIGARRALLERSAMGRSEEWRAGARPPGICLFQYSGPSVSRRHAASEPGSFGEGWHHDVVDGEARDSIAEFEASWLDGVDVRRGAEDACRSTTAAGASVWSFGDDRATAPTSRSSATNGTMKTIIVFGTGRPAGTVAAG